MAKHPIFVIGTHGSGTTLLARALAQHPDVAYWEEPRHVWTRGFGYRSDDSLSAADASPRVQARVRDAFRRHLESKGGIRIAEKTPTNCLRLPFIREIFPDAQFLHIHRDGRAVVHSTDRVTRTRTPETQFYWQRLKGTPLWEWPAFAPRAWDTLGRRLVGKHMAYWGPKPPGWKQWLREDARAVVLAKQWRHTLEPVLDFRDALPSRSSRWLDLRYEELVARPAEHASRIERFCGLTGRPVLSDYLERVCHTDRVHAWRSHIDAETLAAIKPIIEPALDRLGYAWGESSTVREVGSSVAGP